MMNKQNFRKTFTIILCLLGLFVACKTTKPAGKNDFYPKQCPSYDVLNEVSKKRFDNFYGSTYDFPIRGFNWSPKLENLDVYRFEDQDSLQVFVFSGEKDIHSNCGYFSRIADGFPFEKKDSGKLIGRGFAGDCLLLSVEMKEQLEELFKEKQCSIDGIYEKHPDENIMILEKLDSKGVYSFKFIYKKKEKEAIYKILTEIWNKIIVPESGCLPWECIKNKKVFPYDPFKDLREE